jgi:hypothetical protein
MKKEGCIYDKILYEFNVVGSDTLPNFISLNQDNISIDVKTSNMIDAGIY